MNELRLQDVDVSRLAGTLLGHETELCAILFASRVPTSNSCSRFVVTSLEFPDDESYSDRNTIGAELKPEYIAKVAKKASQSGLSLVFVHSHPGSSPPEFSRTDDNGESLLKSFLAARTPGLVHASVVISTGGWRARILGQDAPVRIVSIGQQLQTVFDAGSGHSSPSLTFDRQVRALGAAGQKRLESMLIAIVGLGGTGSIVAEQLAYLGVRNFILMDPDHLESTNLNRVVGANSSDVGRPKVDVAADMILRVADDACISRHIGDVTRTAFARELTRADFIFSCTDSHGSRATIQQIAYQYLVPAIDVGSIITAAAGTITGIHGRVQALSPGLPCFTCCGLLDSEEVRRDMMNEDERRRDPYIQGAQEPAPAVISINGTIVSLAMTMFLSIAVGLPSHGRYLLYDARTPSLRAIAYSRNPNCYICSSQGVLARGDSQELFTRDD